MGLARSAFYTTMARIVWPCVLGQFGGYTIGYLTQAVEGAVLGMLVFGALGFWSGPKIWNLKTE
jgi:hypothetical protein